jgi:hypothetical protein
MIILAAWFFELWSLQRVRAQTAPEQTKPDQSKAGTLSPTTIQDVLKNP